jgi:hypothetical protein
MQAVAAAAAAAVSSQHRSELVGTGHCPSSEPTAAHGVLQAHWAWTQTGPPHAAHEVQHSVYCMCHACMCPQSSSTCQAPRCCWPCTLT